MEYSGAGGKLIHEKKQKQKISWHCPFKMPQRSTGLYKLTLNSNKALLYNMQAGMYESKKRRKFWVTGQQQQGALEHWLLERQHRLNGKCRHYSFQPRFPAKIWKMRKNRLLV